MSLPVLVGRGGLTTFNILFKSKDDQFGSGLRAALASRTGAAIVDNGKITRSCPRNERQMRLLAKAFGV
jgi:hypothetical protein